MYLLVICDVQRMFILNTLLKYLKKGKDIYASCMSDFHDNCIKIMKYAIIKISRYLKFEINWIMFAEFVKILMLNCKKIFNSYFQILIYNIKFKC